MEYGNYFAHTYQEARQNFMACSANQATFVKSWQHPLRGKANEKLYVDLVWFGDLAAKKVMIIVSGTHGIEGFCGSGIQVGSIQTGWHRQADHNLAILMIHGLNPWGMSYFRRVNEEGVDLNRNFLDFQQPLPRNSLYDDLSDVIVPPEWTKETQVKTLNQIVEYLTQSSSQIGALAQGQYHYWYAPFYGGEVPTWSNRVFCQIINQYLKNKQAVGLLDYHTGLGQYAQGQLMSIADNTRETENLAEAIWGDKLVITGSANSVAPYHPQGTLIAALENKLTQSNCLAAAYEFGTIPEVEVFHALRADHWLHAYGDLNSQQAQKIKEDMLHSFFSDRPDWQEAICNLAFTAQEELFAGLKSM